MCKAVIIWGLGQNRSRNVDEDGVLHLFLFRKPGSWIPDRKGKVSCDSNILMTFESNQIAISPQMHFYVHKRNTKKECLPRVPYGRAMWWFYHWGL